MNTLDWPLYVLRICVHLLVAGLLVLGVARAYIGAEPHATIVLAVALVLGATYAAGPLLPRVERSHAAAAGWLAALGIVWLVFLGLTANGVWLAFPMFFVQLHLLPARWGLPAVVVTTIAAIAGFIWHQGQFDVGMVLGPALGAAVSVATVLGYQALYRQNEERRRLIDELRQTRDDLAEAEHSAGVLAERERLAREIHDTVAQGLSSIQLLLHAANRALPDQPDIAAGHVGQARDAAQENLTEARRLVHALAPAQLEDHSLPASLERLCTTTRQRSGMTIRFRLSGEPFDVPTPYEVALLRIAQSALANTTQHAHATSAEMTLRYAEAGVYLDIVDDGVGFDPQSVNDHSSGFGLHAMRDRADSLGGTWSLESSPGNGTALTVHFPRTAGTPDDPATIEVSRP